MSKFSNILKMIIILKSRKRVKTKELAQILGVSERMIRKYMEDLEEANVHVLSTTGPTGGFELIGYDYLTHLVVESEEIVALKVAGHLLQNDSSYKFINQLNNLSDKISIITEQVENDKYNVLTHDNRDVDVGLLFQAASITRNKVEIVYKSAKSDTSKRVVRPYALIDKSGFQYLIAYCEKRKEIRTFKLVRMQSVSVLEETFDPDKSFDIKTFTKDSIGLFNDEELKLVLEIREPFSYSVSERTYAANQVIEWKNDKTIIFKATMKGKVDIVRWIISMTTYVAVLEPLSLKEEIREELEKMLTSI
ncbi:MAG: transcriptional regulator [Clostridium sp.]|nr:transcriptional regulator [Clostridium sp.]